MNAADEQYEKHLCEQVLELTRIVYKTNSASVYPPAKVIMAKTPHATKEDIRDQIQECVDFLSMSLRYMVFDVEALRREINTLKKSKGR